MFMMKQGDIANRRQIDMLEKRIEMLEKRAENLENMVNALQLPERPRMGRPPKVKDEPTKEQEAS